MNSTNYLPKFRDCLDSEVKSQPVVRGSFLVVRDTGDMYYDTLEGSRMVLGKTVHVVNGVVTSEFFPSDGHIYYSATDKNICVYSNGEFQPINIVPYHKTIHGDVAANGNQQHTITPTAMNDVLSVIVDSINTDRTVVDLFTAANITATVSSDKKTLTIANAASYAWFGTVDVTILGILSHVA